MASGMLESGPMKEVQATFEPLLRLHGLLSVSRHIYAEYQRKLVEQELARCGASSGRRLTGLGTNALRRHIP
jgi:hypothetical protein